MHQIIRSHHIPFFSQTVPPSKTYLAVQLLNLKSTFSKRYSGPVNGLFRLGWPSVANRAKSAGNKSHKFCTLENLFASGHELKGRLLIISMGPVASLTCG